MTKNEQIRNYFRKYPGNTLKDCTEALGFEYGTVKQCVWNDSRRGLVTKDIHGCVVYVDEFELPAEIDSDPAKQAAWTMLEILMDRAKQTIDDDMLLKFSKEIRLYIGELK